MSTGDWFDTENDLIVADHFAMLGDDLSGRHYNKAAHNRRLQDLTGRSEGSIEFKHQNVSAVLLGLGEAWITGYKPAFNFQTSLVDAVALWLGVNRGWFARVPAPLMNAAREAAPIWVGIAPTLRNTPPPDELEKMQAVVRRFDVAARDERNRALGRAGYDIASFTPEGRERLIEVKTTNGWDRTPFHISANELAVAEERRESWRLFRLWNFARDPKAFELYPPLDRHVSLTPSSFQAGFP